MPAGNNRWNIKFALLCAAVCGVLLICATVLASLLMDCVDLPPAWPYFAAGDDGDTSDNQSVSSRATSPANPASPAHQPGGVFDFQPLYVNLPTPQGENIEPQPGPSWAAPDISDEQNRENQHQLLPIPGKSVTQETAGYDTEGSNNGNNGCEVKGWEDQIQLLLLIDDAEANTVDGTENNTMDEPEDNMEDSTVDGLKDNIEDDLEDNIEDDTVDGLEDNIEDGPEDNTKDNTEYIGGDDAGDAGEDAGEDEVDGDGADPGGPAGADTGADSAPQQPRRTPRERTAKAVCSQQFTGKQFKGPCW